MLFQHRKGTNNIDNNKFFSRKIKKKEWNY